MNHAHWWLFGLSFAMGFVLTFALLVRPVKRQVPVRTSVISESPTTKIPVAVDPPTTRMPTGNEFPTTKIRVAQEPPTTRIAVSPLAPYGPGSANPGPGGAGPPGWLVKGQIDTEVFYTPDDPTYDLTIAQVWFIDEECAVRAGFTRWRNRL